MKKLSVHMPNLQPHQVVHLDLNVGDKQLPLIFLTAAVLTEVWACRKEKKPCRLFAIRAGLEASINILRKSRHKAAAEILFKLLE